MSRSNPYVDFDKAKRLTVTEVAHHTGCHFFGHNSDSFGPCPNCDATYREKGHRRGACEILPAGTKGCDREMFYCQRCKAAGDAVKLVAWQTLSREPSKTDYGLSEVRQRLSEIMGNDAKPLPKKLLKAIEARPARDTDPPPRHDLERWLDGCYRVNGESTKVSAYLGKRYADFIARCGFDRPRETEILSLIERRCLVRAFNFRSSAGGALPAWWPSTTYADSGRTRHNFHPSDFPLVLPLVSARGDVRTAFLRAVDKTKAGESKGIGGRWRNLGGKGGATGSLAADVNGVRMLRGETSPAGVWVVEGPTSVIACSLLLHYRGLGDVPVIGIHDGSEHAIKAVTWPDSVRDVVGGTDPLSEKEAEQAAKLKAQGKEPPRTGGELYHSHLREAVMTANAYREGIPHMTLHRVADWEKGQEND